jgi:hypothetical protein
MSACNVNELFFLKIDDANFEITIKLQGNLFDCPAILRALLIGPLLSKHN